MERRGGQVLLGNRRAAGKFVLRSIADVAEVGNADFAGVVAVAGEVAEKGEERNAGAERRILLGVLAEGNEVEKFFFLFRSALQKNFAEKVGAEIVEPGKAPAE